MPPSAALGMRSVGPWLVRYVGARRAAARCATLSIAALLATGAAQGQSARPVDSPPTARVVGTVFDSLSNTPLVGATVRVALANDPATGQTRTTGADGRFTVDSLPFGIWLATFSHPVADSLGITPPVARLDVRDASELQLTLALPRARSLIAARCGAGVAADTTLGYLYGLVRHSADDRPLAGASLAIEWPEWVLQRRQVRTEMQRVVTRTDSAGWYSACGVPAEAVVRTVAWSGTDSTGTIAVDVPVNGWRRRDFSVATARAVTAADSTPGLQADSLAVTRYTVRVGEATLRGRVIDENDRPVGDATVRLLGTGRAVRSRVDGRFDLAQAVAGSQTVEARAIGFSPSRLPVELREGEVANIDIILPVQRVALDTVRVTANRKVNSQVRAFESRWRQGVGKFLDEDFIKRHVHRFLADALVSMPGTYVTEVGGYGRRILMNSMSGGRCAATLFVDGVQIPTGSGPAEMFLDDFVTWTEVVGVEVYPRGAVIPAEFMSGGCGVVAVWTRQRFDGVSPRNPRRR